MIRVKDLHAGYGKKSEALHGLDLEINPGRIYALLGPNGAGKTTFLRCLTGLLKPSSGSLLVLGTELSDAQNRSGNVNEFPQELFQRIGILMESPNGYARMTVSEYLRFFAGFYSTENSSSRINARIQELAEAFELESLSTRIGKLSQGNKRKVQLMRSLLHKPELILWDEPTEHLDPRAQRLVLSHLRRTVSAGAAALVTSHRLEQMEEIGDDFGFLKHGLLVHTLMRKDADRNVESVEIEGAGIFDTIALKNLSSHFDSVQTLDAEQLKLGSWGFRIRSSQILTLLPEMINVLVGGGAQILRVEPRSRTLDDLYRHYVEDAP